MQLDSSVHTISGTRTASAGLAYATQGRATISSFDPDEGEVLGTCRGSGGAVYTTVVWIDRNRTDSVIFAGGECSCPVEVDCKHAVALYLTLIAALPGAGTPVVKQPAAAPSEWESLLGRIFEQGPPEEPTPLALGFNFSPATTGRARFAGTARTPTAKPAGWATLRVRPLRMGKRGTWIQTGTSWRDFHYSAPSSVPPAQARPLVALATYLGQVDYYGGGSGWHGLEASNTMPPWALLRDARDAGIALVEASNGQRPVVLVDEPAETVVDLVTTRGDLRLEAKVVLPDGVRLDGLLPIGEQAVGVAGRDADGRLTVVGFRHAAPREWGAVRQAGGARIPEADRPRFERTVLPRIARRVGWQSSDQSFAPTPPAPPVLEIDVELADDARSPPLSLRWGGGTGPPQMACASRSLPAPTTSSCAIRSRSTRPELRPRKCCGSCLHSSTVTSLGRAPR